MKWIEAKYSKRKVDRAGRAWDDRERLSSRDLAFASRVARNWRSAHAFPLNTFQNGLRQRVRSVCDDAIVSQRLKRLPSMIRKLERFPHMKLSQMQDIGGCRAVVESVAHVYKLQASYRKSRIRHVLANEKDYIASPKISGYRGIHLVYRYRSDKMTAYNGLLIEVQLRTKLQHAWATAVETAGAVLGEDLKSSRGGNQWLKFFAMAGSVFALEEGCATVPDTPGDLSSLRQEIYKLYRSLDVVDTLRDYSDLIGLTDDPQIKRWHFILLQRRPDQNRTIAMGYKQSELETATQHYRRVENEIRNIKRADVVLVSVDSLQSLKRAYPNYYLDTSTFVEELARVTRGEDNV